MNEIKWPQPMELKRGSLYALEFDARLKPEHIDSIKRQLEPFTSKYGCNFVVIDGGARLVKEPC
jgi:hypothetical protein